MDQPQTPTSNPEQPKNPEQPEVAKEHAYLQEAETIRKALVIEEESGKWKKLLTEIFEEPLLPQDSKKAPVAVKTKLLPHLYLVLRSKQRELVELIGASITIIQRGTMLRTHREALKRGLAEYLDQKQQYDQIWNGGVPAPSRLPPYLASYIESSERENVSVRIAEVILPMQFDVLEKAKVKKSPRKVARYSREILMSAVRSRMTMRHVLACLDSKNALVTDEKKYADFLAFAGYGRQEITKEDTEAVKLIVGYLAKNRDIIQEYVDYSTTENLEDLLIADALECCASNSVLGEIVTELALQIPGLLQAELPDMRAIVRKVTESKDMYPERAVHVALAPLSDLSKDASKDEKEEFQKNAKEVTSFLLGFQAKRAKIRNVDLHIAHLNKKQKDMVKELCKHVTTDKFIKSVLGLALIPKNAGERSDDEKEVASILSSLLQKKKEISVRDAFELYYFSEVNDGSSSLVTFKVVNLLRNEDPALATRFEQSRIRKLMSMAASSLGNFDASLDELQLTDRQKTELRNVRLYLKEEGIDSFWGWWNRFWAWYWSWPEVTVPLTVANSVGLITGAGLVVMRGYVWFNVRGLETFANMGAEEVRERYNVGEDVSTDTISLAQEEVTALLNEHARLSHRFHRPFRGRTLRVQATAIMRSALTGELTKITKALAKRFSLVEDVAERLAKIEADDTKVKSALEGAGFSDQDVQRGMVRVASVRAQMLETQEQVKRGVVEALKTEMEALLKGARELRRVSGSQRDRLEREHRERAQRFQSRVSEAESKLPGIRKELAEYLAGRELADGDTLWQAIEEIHAEPSIDEKKKIYERVAQDMTQENRNILKDAMRIGLAGNAEVVEVVPVSNVGALLSDPSAAGGSFRAGSADFGAGSAKQDLGLGSAGLTSGQRRVDDGSSGAGSRKKKGGGRR